MGVIALDAVLFQRCEGCELNCQARNGLHIATVVLLGEALNKLHNDNNHPTGDEYVQLYADAQAKLRKEPCNVFAVTLPRFMYAACGKILILESVLSGQSKNFAIGVNRDCPITVCTTGVAYGVQDIDAQSL